MEDEASSTRSGHACLSQARLSFPSCPLKSGLRESNVGIGGRTWLRIPTERRQARHRGQHRQRLFLPEPFHLGIIGVTGRIAATSSGLFVTSTWNGKAVSRPDGTTSRCFLAPMRSSICPTKRGRARARVTYRRASVCQCPCSRETHRRAYISRPAAFRRTRLSRLPSHRDRSEAP